MTAATCHAERARNLIKNGIYSESWTEFANGLEALVHATLAVAEEQRLANLIAFCDLADRQARNGLLPDPEGSARFTKAAELVREGLGL